MFQEESLQHLKSLLASSGFKVQFPMKPRPSTLGVGIFNLASVTHVTVKPLISLGDDLFLPTQFVQAIA
jgi:hypothetical protein